MGATLSEANLSTVVEKKSAHGFHAGLAEMNGWRKKMEDAHVIHMREDWAFFGVFDGHGGDQCSTWIAKEFYARLERDGCPKDDAAIKKLVLDLDAEFLATETPSGTTAAMCIVHRPTTPGGKIRLRVANAGDSRVLLGKRDGSIVDGGGTDSGLSTDHKPNHPPEQERIERCGGTVEIAPGGVARVNGDLAVSRGFGDGEYKKTGGPGPEDRPVTADPELQEFECDESDILIIVCDGVSEGDFSNPEVVQLISEKLKEDGDPGAAARATVLHAEKKNSKDNITCMVILFDGNQDECKESKVFTPGPLGPKFDKPCADNYEAMAKRYDEDMTLGKALEMRYDDMIAELAQESLAAERQDMLNIERGVFGLSGDAEPKGEKGSDERSEWFNKWADEKLSSGGGDDQSLMLRQMLSSGGGNFPGISGGLLQQLVGRGSDQPQDGRKVRCVDNAQTLQDAVEAHDALKWDIRLANIVGKDGVCLKEDTSDSTMQIKFPEAAFQAWLPTSVLTILEDSPEGAEGGASGGSAGYEGDSAP